MKSNFDISLISFCFTIWCLCFTLFFKPVELWLNNIQQNLLTMYISAIAGSIALIELCKLIKCSWLSTFGINSIIPMCTHVPILYVIQICFYPNNWIEWFCLNIFLFFVSYSTIYIFKNKYYNLIKFPY